MMQRNIDFYYKRGIDEGFYDVQLINNVIEHDETIRNTYIAGYIQGKMIRSNLTNAQSFPIKKHRLEYIRQTGYDVGYNYLPASEEKLKDPEEIAAFKAGFEAGDYTRQVENYVLEQTKSSYKK